MEIIAPERQGRQRWGRFLMDVWGKKTAWAPLKDDGRLRLVPWNRPSVFADAGGAWGLESNVDARCLVLDASLYLFWTYPYVFYFFSAVLLSVYLFERIRTLYILLFYCYRCWILPMFTPCVLLWRGPHRTSCPIPNRPAVSLYCSGSVSLERSSLPLYKFWFVSCWIGGNKPCLLYFTLMESRREGSLIWFAFGSAALLCFE